MPRKARVKSISGIYHIMLRGVNRQEIFHDEEDRMKFLQLLEKYKEKSLVNIYAWCLMGNHIHLLLREGNEDISITMKRIGVSFVTYYNRKYRMVGHLFQDRFRSENVETNNYLLTVTRYIHQNPVKAGIVSNVDEWQWGSCLGYYGKQYVPMGLLDRDFILQLFSKEQGVTIERFREFNEESNDDQCMDDFPTKLRKSDEDARIEIKELLGPIEIAQVKILPRLERNKIFRAVKRIDGVSHRQLARIFGVSASLVYRA